MTRTLNLIAKAGGLLFVAVLVYEASDLSRVLWEKRK